MRKHFSERKKCLDKKFFTALTVISLCVIASAAAAVAVYYATDTAVSIVEANTNTTTDSDVTDSTTDSDVTDSTTDFNVTNSTVDFNVTNSTVDFNVTNSTTDFNVTNSTTDFNVTNSTVDFNVTNSTTDFNVTNSTTDFNVTNSTVDFNITNSTADSNVTNSTVDFNITNSTADSNVTNSTADSNVTCTNAIADSNVAYTNSTTDFNVTNSTTDFNVTNSTADSNITCTNAIADSNVAYTNSTTDFNVTNSTTDFNVICTNVTENSTVVYTNVTENSTVDLGAITIDATDISGVDAVTYSAVDKIGFQAGIIYKSMQAMKNCAAATWDKRFLSSCIESVRESLKFKNKFVGSIFKIKPQKRAFDHCSTLFALQDGTTEDCSSGCSDSCSSMYDCVRLNRVAVEHEIERLKTASHYDVDHVAIHKKMQSTSLYRGFSVLIKSFNYAYDCFDSKNFCNPYPYPPGSISFNEKSHVIFRGIVDYCRDIRGVYGMSGDPYETCSDAIIEQMKDRGESKSKPEINDGDCFPKRSLDAAVSISNCFYKVSLNLKA